MQDGNVRFINKYDEPLLHLMFAGSDIMLCPSFDDPVLQVPVCILQRRCQIWLAQPFVLLKTVWISLVIVYF